MIVAIHQPTYAPWLGFFAKLHACDCFILLDDAQLPQGRSYVSRTQIETPRGVQWLTVPVRRQHLQRINEAQIADEAWASQHLKTLQYMYGRARNFQAIFDALVPVYQRPEQRLVTLNLHLIRVLVQLLGLRSVPRIELASTLGCEGQGAARLAALTARVGGSCYLSGPTGRAYLSEECFAQRGLTLRLGRYASPAYPQHPNTPFVAGLSALDALFHVGGDAGGLLQYERL